MAPSIFIVSTDDGIREVLVRVVRKLGTEPVTYDSAGGFLRRSDSAPIDCLLVDDELGTMSGLSMLEKWTRKQADARVILLLGAPDADTTARAGRLGLTMIDKPFDVRKLAAMIGPGAGGPTTEPESPATPGPHAASGPAPVSGRTLRESASRARPARDRPPCRGRGLMLPPLSAHPA